MHAVPLDDGLVRIVGALDFDRTEGGLTPRRLPSWTRPQVPPFMEIMVTQTSGVRIEFATTTRRVELDVLLTGLEIPGRPPAPAVFDLVLGDGTVHSTSVTEGNRLIVNLARRDQSELISGSPATVTVADLPAGEKHCELWLPANAAVELRELRVDDDADVRSIDHSSARRRWVHHGSSISHCAGAYSPTRTWPAVAARLAGVELLNLGFGGNCHLDPFVARTMRDEPADVISLKAGINVVNADSLKERTFAPALHGFLDTIREGHPETPVLVVSPIICPSAETQPGPTVPNAAGVFETIPGHAEVRAGSLSLQRMRAIMRSVIEGRQASDPNLHYLDGLQLFGPDDVGDLPDALHPNGDGYVRMGERFCQLAFSPGAPLAGG